MGNELHRENILDIPSLHEQFSAHAFIFYIGDYNIMFFPHGYWETQCGTFPFAFNFHVKMFNSVCLPLGIGLEFVKIQMPNTQRRKHYHPSQFLWVVLNHDLVTSDYAQCPSCSEGIMRPGIELIFGPCPRIDMLAGGETTQSG